MKLVDVSLRALRADERKSLQGIAHFCSWPIAYFAALRNLVAVVGHSDGSASAPERGRGTPLSLDRLGLDLLNIRFNRPAGSFASQVPWRPSAALPSSPCATWPIKLKTSHCSLTMIGLYCLAPNQPTFTSANAPMAVTDAPMDFS